MIDTNQIVEKLDELAIRHQALGNNLEDLEDAEWLETEAQGLIADYCEQIGLQVEGFPHAKRKLAIDDEYNEDYKIKKTPPKRGVFLLNYMKNMTFHIFFNICL